MMIARCSRMGTFLVAIVLVLLSSGLAADAARPDVPSRARRTNVRAQVRIHADTLVQQALVSIRSNAADSAWLEQSSARLLDRPRGDESALDSAIPDTVIRSIRAIANAARVSVTDTLVRSLGSLILQLDALERDRRAGWVRRAADGSWVMLTQTASDDLEHQLEFEYVRLRVDEYNSHRAAMMAELHRQGVISQR